MVKVLPCGCRHEYQDQTYRRGNRVHNHLKAVVGRPQEYRCTVCRKVRS